MRPIRLSAAVALAALTAACGPSSNGGGNQNAAAPAAPEAAAPAAPAAPAAAPAMAPEEVQKLLASLPAPYNTGDLAAGKLQFNKCLSCHTVTKGGPALTGPNLYGIFGERAGVRPGFPFSPAMKAATFTWDEAHMDQWTASPVKMLPGTKMTFPGIKDPKQRIDLVAYLKVASSGGPI
jgi:cytochrome c